MSFQEYAVSQKEMWFWRESSFRILSAVTRMLCPMVTTVRTLAAMVKVGQKLKSGVLIPNHCISSLCNCWAHVQEDTARFPITLTISPSRIFCKPDLQLLPGKVLRSFSLLWVLLLQTALPTLSGVPVVRRGPFAAGQLPCFPAPSGH